MPRPLTPEHLIVLPRLNATGTITLAQALEVAARAQASALQAFSFASIQEALQELVADREALQAAVAEAEAQSPNIVREADRREDLAISALHDLLAIWARLAEELPQGRVAERVYQRLFGDDGLSFIYLPVQEEWAVVDAKLFMIAFEGMDKSLAQIGAQPILELLQGIHAKYGEAIGTLGPAQLTEPPAVRDRREALLASIRLYILRVVGAVDRKNPESSNIVSALLEPIAERRAPVAAGGAILPLDSLR
ncbi:MAG TPA: hypothetical protein VH877_19375 [Polyangia bacterium]|jgi:hypothetical protein|nr:hypothetical protein [Polyangia bacterium]